MCCYLYWLGMTLDSHFHLCISKSTRNMYALQTCCFSGIHKNKTLPYFWLFNKIQQIEEGKPNQQEIMQSDKRTVFLWCCMFYAQVHVACTFTMNVFLGAFYISNVITDLLMSGPINLICQWNNMIFNLSLIILLFTFSVFWVAKWIVIKIE